MPVDFPTSPTLYQTYTNQGITWRWNGSAWDSLGAAIVYAPMTPGFKNRLINGAMQINQRDGTASRTYTAGATLAYGVDRWYGYCTGANVTGATVTGSGSILNYYRFTGAAGVTGIGFGQRIEALNCADMAGQSVTLSAYLANSLLTSVTWTAYYANTADTFGTLASPTRTQIATGTFTVNSTLTQYSATFSVPAAATTGIEIVFSVGAQTSGTWTIANTQLELGGTVTGFDARPVSTEIALCQRYYEIGEDRNYEYASNAGVAMRLSGQYQVFKRVTPTVTPTVSGNVLFGTTYTTEITTPRKFIGYILPTGAGYGYANLNWTATAEL